MTTIRSELKTKVYNQIHDRVYNQAWIPTNHIWILVSLEIQHKVIQQVNSQVKDQTYMQFKEDLL